MFFAQRTYVWLRELAQRVQIYSGLIITYVEIRYRLTKVELVTYPISGVITYIT